MGSVLYNYSTTRKVTLTEMINHSKSVRLGVKKSLMVVDMPYNTYRNPKEALKNARLEALKTYTINAAYAAFEEEVKGSIEIGKYADFTVLSQNIITIPEREILKTKVIYTIINGKIEYKNID